jgi:hypothetical protein
VTGGFWSAYWYNGQIYGSEIARGVDVFRLIPSEYLTQNEIDAAGLARSEEFNPQEQPRIVWPASFVVARAYIDQLARTNALPQERVRALRAALDRGDKVRSGDKSAAATLDQLDSLASQVDKDAGAAAKADAARLRALAAAIKGRTAALRQG